MEKLQPGSSENFVTASGLCAVIPFHRSRVRDGVAAFEFRTSFDAPVVSVEWPADSDVALIPAEFAAAMTARNWGRYLTQEEADTFNAAVAASQAEPPQTETAPDGTPPPVEPSPDGTTPAETAPPVEPSPVPMFTPPKGKSSR